MAQLEDMPDGRVLVRHRPQSQSASQSAGVAEIPRVAFAADGVELVIAEEAKCPIGRDARAFTSAASAAQTTLLWLARAVGQCRPPAGLR